MNDHVKLVNDLGTFHGFNHSTQSAIMGDIPADDVVNWDHDANGEAEFWPSGDHEGVALVFKGNPHVSIQQILQLDDLIDTMGDEIESYLRIYHAINCFGYTIEQINHDTNIIDNEPLNIYAGSNFIDTRTEAAWDLFETYYPELYKALQENPCDGVAFDEDTFLKSPGWYVDEIEIDGACYVLIQSQ